MPREIPILRLAVLCTVCALLGSAPRAQAQAQPAPYPPAPWPAPPGAWQGAPPQYLVPALDYELMRIDMELARLRAERPRLFWPIALTASGGAVAIFGMAGLVTISSTWREQRYRWDEEGNRQPYTYVDPADREAMREFGVITGIGLGVLAGGLVMLVPRVRTRRKLAEQAAPLKRRRLELLGSTQPSLSFDVHGAQAAARFRF